MQRVIPLVLFPVSLFFVLLLPGCSSTQTTTKWFTALKFARYDYTHIAFRPDMSSMTEEFSVCLWIRKLLTSGHPCPFAYNRNELFMSADGYYNRLFGSSSLNGALTSKFTVPVGSWYFYCSTWSLQSRYFTIYLNGKKIGWERTSPGRRLQTGHTMVLGNYEAGSQLDFRGEIFNFNMFSKKLIATEVASLYSIGFCSGIPESLEHYRVIKWEEILKLSRSGYVQDFIEPTCAAADELQKELEGVKRQLETAEEQFTETRRELEETKLELKIVSESKCALVKGNLTKWDVLYSPPFYNKEFTRQLYQKLRTTWDAFNCGLFGVTMTDSTIDLLKRMNEEENCDDL